MNSPFKVPADSYSTGTTKQIPGIYDLDVSQLRSYPAKGYPNRRLRYREMGKDIYQVECWLENNVKNKGVMGRARSVLVSRYHLKRLRKKIDKTYNYYFRLVGDAQVWYFNGDVKDIYKYVLGNEEEGQARFIYHVAYDARKRLTDFEDFTRGVDAARIVDINYDSDGKRYIKRWRGRYHERVTSNGYGSPDGQYIIRRNENGLPLNDKVDYTARTYEEGGVLSREEHWVGGEKHGFEREFNKFGRVITEQYWHRGVEVPDWVYLDPKQVTAEEIQDEENEKLRGIMLELQGAELYQVRAMARSMRAISRGLIKQDAVVQTELVVVKRPGLEG